MVLRLLISPALLISSYISEKCEIQEKPVLNKVVIYRIKSSKTDDKGKTSRVRSQLSFLPHLEGVKLFISIDVHDLEVVAALIVEWSAS